MRAPDPSPVTPTRGERPPITSDGFWPPAPPLLPDGAGGWRVLAGLRRNGFGAFPARCFDEPVVRLRIPGRALFIASGAEAIVTLLQTKAADFGRVPTAQRVLGPLTGRGLLTSEGEHWRRQRKAMAPAFGPRTLPMMAAHVMRAATLAVDRLQAIADGPVDLLAEMQALSLDIAATSMFSIEPGGLRNELRALVTRYIATIGRPSPEDFLLPAWAPTPLALRRRVFRQRWLRLIGAVVAGRRRASLGDDARDLFDLLLAAHSADAGELLIDEVATMLIAGHETTALTLFWALYLLAQSPPWRAAVAAEAAGVDLAPDRAAAALPALPVTRAVVNETLRLFSPAFLTARIALRPTSLSDRTVPRGSLVLAPLWILHRTPRYWADPGCFRPERFLDAAPPRDHFLPFGTGPHVCIGAQLATTEAVLVLAALLSRVTPRLLDPERPVLPVATLSTRPEHAPLFRLERRSPL